MVWFGLSRQSTQFGLNLNLSSLLFVGCQFQVSCQSLCSTALRSLLGIGNSRASPRVCAGSHTESGAPPSTPLSSPKFLLFISSQDLFLSVFWPKYMVSLRILGPHEARPTGPQDVTPQLELRADCLALPFLGTPDQEGPSFPSGGVVSLRGNGMNSWGGGGGSSSNIQNSICGNN